VEEPALLSAVDRVVGRVQIEHDLVGRRGGVRLQEQLDEELLDGGRIELDLLVTLAGGDARRGQLEPVERALASERLAAITAALAHLARWIELAHQRRQQWIVAQRVVIVQILVAERQRVGALGNQLLDRVLDERWVAVVGKAARELRDDARGALTLAQQQRAAVGRDRAAVKTGHHFARTKGLELGRFCATVCPHEAVSAVWSKCLWINYLYHSERPRATSSVRNAG